MLVIAYCFNRWAWFTGNHNGRRFSSFMSTLRLTLAAAPGAATRWVKGLTSEYKMFSASASDIGFSCSSGVMEVRNLLHYCTTEWRTTRTLWKLSVMTAEENAGISEAKCLNTKFLMRKKKEKFHIQMLKTTHISEFGVTHHPTCFRNAMATQQVGFNSLLPETKAAISPEPLTMHSILQLGPHDAQGDVYSLGGCSSVGYGGRPATPRSSVQSPLSPLVASRSVHEQGTEPPVAAQAHHCSPLLLEDGLNAENTFCCLCTCTLCNDNRLNPMRATRYFTFLLHTQSNCHEVKDA